MCSISAEKRRRPKIFFEGAGGLKTIEARIGTKTPLLILGDNPILDTWRWLKLDRAGQPYSSRSAVIPSRSSTMVSPRAARRPLVARQFLASLHGISIASDATFYRVEHFFRGSAPGD